MEDVTQFSAEALKSNMEVGENSKKYVKMSVKSIPYGGSSPISN